MDSATFDTYLVIAGFLVGILMYLMPSIVAYERKHHQKVAIFILNIFVGWTFFGWVACLVWACTEVRRQQPPIHYV